MKGLDYVQTMNVDAEDIENKAYFYLAARLTEELFIEGLDNNMDELTAAFTAWDAASATAARRSRAPSTVDSRAIAPRAITVEQHDAAWEIARAARAVKESAGQYWMGRVADAAFDTAMTALLATLSAAITAFPPTAEP